MSDTTKKPPGRHDRRQARLEQALRENLKKRKELARKRTAADPASIKPDLAGNSDAPVDD